MTPPDPLIGALFDGRYKILKKLGTGGMATVYLAEDQELGRRIAIKILNAKHASDKQFVERFRRGPPAPPVSHTPTSCRSTTAATPRALTTSRWR